MALGVRGGGKTSICSDSFPSTAAQRQNPEVLLWHLPSPSLPCTQSPSLTAYLWGLLDVAPIYSLEYTPILSFTKTLIKEYIFLTL